MNNIVFKDNQIIIGPAYLRKEIIEHCNLKYSIKYFDYNELKDNYIYSYKDDTLVYIYSKFNYIPEIGEKIINNLYEIDENKNYKSKKLNNLVRIKKDLIENGYIIKNYNIKSFLKNKDILFFKINCNSITNKIMNEISKNNNVTIINEEILKKDSLDIYEFETLEEEILFVANKIYDLVKNGVSLDKIKINNIDNVYNSTIFRIFNYYNIPISSFDNKLYFLSDVRLFLSKLDNDTEILSINNILKDLEIDEKIKEKLVLILNKYVDYKYVKDIYNILIYDLKNTNINFDSYKNIINIIDYKNYKPASDEYIFMVGFNQDVIPIIHKDDKYLSDSELEEIGSNSSFEKNEIEKSILYSFIMNTKNLFISYKLNSNFNTFSPSNYIDELKEKVVVNKKKVDYDYRNKHINELLLGKRLDDFIRYGYQSEDLLKLHSNYDILYNTYDNRYKKIDYEIIKKQLGGKIRLSYSNTNTFFRCKFRFLLDSIYKLSEFNEVTISQKIGTLFHDILYNVYKNNRFDYDDVINEEFNKIFLEKTKKEDFYIKKYKKVIKKLIDVLNENLKSSNYKNKYFEEWFEVDKPNDLKVSIVGKIDKIMVLEDKDKTYVIVIDYKTGKLHGDFNKVIYGLDMQLLYYLYLIKNTNKIENPIFTGMYLQPILSDIMPRVDGKTYENQIISNMKLNGFTTSKTDRIKDIDKKWESNSFIKGIKAKADGTLYAYANTLSDKQISKLIDIVDENIESVIKSINNSDFEINPKKIDKENVGCEYCTYKDICYMNVNNIVNLKKHKDLDFLEGEEDD